VSDRARGNPALRVAWVLLVGALCLCANVSLALDPFAEKAKIQPLDFQSNRKLEAQRDLVAELARRYVGSKLSGTSLDDLRILQRLFDRYPASDQGLILSRGSVVPDEQRLFEMQALGVVLGDVMAHHFDLEWVVVDDEYGRGRALNVKGTTDLVFPVTMLSKRYEFSQPVNMRALYDEIAETLAAKPEARKRRQLPKLDPE
jgi:hypothetical protein